MRWAKVGAEGGNVIKSPVTVLAKPLTALMGVGNVEKQRKIINNCTTLEEKLSVCSPLLCQGSSTAAFRTSS